MASKAEKWADIEDEETQKSFEPRTEVQSIVRQKDIVENGVSKTIKETIHVTKRIFPVRRAVKERKTLAKFGEVKDVKNGENKIGDFSIGEVISIVTPESEEKQEIDLVTKILGITADSIRDRKNRNELEQLKEEEDGEDKEESRMELEKQKRLKMQGAGFTPEEFTIKISNIFFADGSDIPMEDQERDFRIFISETTKFEDRKDYNLKVVRQKNDKTKLSEVAYLSCTHKERFSKIEASLNEQIYNNCILQISKAAPAIRTYRQGDNRDNRDNRDRKDRR